MDTGVGEEAGEQLDLSRAVDLQEDMYFLEMVESGFNPHSYSSAAAVGLRQFMTSTAKGMGLRVDWWVDERRDPVRSTQAAVRDRADVDDRISPHHRPTPGIPRGARPRPGHRPRRRG